jgi:flagellar motility protein MotE (MotC chaperone)
MTTLLRNPFVTAATGLLLSVAVGVYLFWRTAQPIVVQIMAQRAKAAAAAAPKKEKGWDFWTIEIENLSNELKEERARQKKQAELLDQREARIAAEQKELATMRGEIEGLRQEIAEKVIAIREDEAKNLRSLAQTYTNLSPRAAVAIVRELDDITAVKILFLMKPDVVGPIFEEMSKTTGSDGTPLARRAAVLSEKLRLMKANKSSTPS